MTFISTGVCTERFSRLKELVTEVTAKAWEGNMLGLNVSPDVTGVARLLTTN